MEQVIESKVYITSKEDCEERIKENARVCSGCGGQLTAIETVDNSYRPTYWCGCEKCGKFDSGVSSYVFQIAEEMVKKQNFVPYSHMGVLEVQPVDEREYWLSTQISKTTGIVLSILILEIKYKPQ